MSECRSYKAGQLVCADGFLQKPICRGVFGCHWCGRVSDRETPNCLKDELPDHWLKADGSPAFYRPGAQP